MEDYLLSLGALNIVCQLHELLIEGVSRLSRRNRYTLADFTSFPDEFFDDFGLFFTDVFDFSLPPLKTPDDCNGSDPHGRGFVHLRFKLPSLFLRLVNLSLRFGDSSLDFLHSS